jgi:hypothetical protein
MCLACVDSTQRDRLIRSIFYDPRVEEVVLYELP